MAHDGWETFDHEGTTLAWRIEHDEDAGRPWEREEGHGPVTDWVTRGKRPGERLLWGNRSGLRLYYDWQAAIAQAKAEGWDAAPHGTGTKGQRAERAVAADFARLSAWCRDEWSYVGVIVAPVCEDCGEPKEAESVSLWGIESDADDYLEQVRDGLAAELLSSAS